jgi:hypothetical protein
MIAESFGQMLDFNHGSAVSLAFELTGDNGNARTRLSPLPKH